MNRKPHIQRMCLLLLVTLEFSAEFFLNFTSTSQCHERHKTFGPALHKTQTCVQGPHLHLLRKSEEVDAMIQDCFAIADSNMFQCSSDSIDVFTTTVTGFIRKCIDDVIPTVTVLLYLKQKPGVNGEISTVGAAEGRTAHNNGRNGQMEWHQTPRNHVFVVFDTVFNSSQGKDKDAYRTSRYNIHRAIKHAKGQYRSKIESY